MQPARTITPATFTVVIPLYNKRGQIERAVCSAASQSNPPLEILVVDDGSTDGGAELVEGLTLPLVRVIRQQNAGVSTARNRGAQEARGEYVALLDADDWWDEDFLHHIGNLIKHYPGCGIYCTGFWVHRKQGVFLNDHKVKFAGVVENYFRTAFSSTICWTSAIAIPRTVFLEVGGFPEGMRRGQDLYMWTKVALHHKVCYFPGRMSNYDLTVASNSRSRYRLEEKNYSFMDFYTPGQDDLNEYLARYQIGLGILQSVNGYTDRARQSERECAFTRRCRLGLWKLRVLNRLPAAWRKPALNLYQRLAWLVSRKGILE